MNQMDTNQLPPQTTNPLMGRIRIPGESFTLPSQGLFYNSGELSQDVTNGEIHILPMTAVDEIAFRSVDKLFTGKAVEEVLSRRVPQLVKPMDLLAKDVDYLLTCLRQMSYGPSIDVIYEHDCVNAKQHTYDVDISTFIKGAKKIDPTTIAKTFMVTLSNGQVVKLRPILFRDVVHIYKSTESNQNMTEDEANELAFDTIVAVIVAVDEVTDKAHIKEWFKNIPVYDATLMRSYIENTSDWGATFKTKQVCKDCGQEVEFLVTTNPLHFFI